MKANGLVLVALMMPGVSACAADAPKSPVPVILHMPFVFEADQVPTPTAAKLDVPFIAIGLDRDAFMKSTPGDAADASFIGYLKAVATGDNAARAKFFAQDQSSGSISMKADNKISPIEIGSFFPENKDGFDPSPGATVRIPGKIPIEGGFAYVVAVRSKDSPPNSFLTSVVATAGNIPKVSLLNSFTFLNSLGASLGDADTLLKSASPGAPGQTLAPKNVADFLLSRANPAAAGDILKAIDYFQKHRGKDSYTRGEGTNPISSQSDFDKDFVDLDAKNQDLRLLQIASNARDIDYILDFDPVYITVQKTRGAAVDANSVMTKDGMNLAEGVDEVFYYLRGKDGRLRFTGTGDEFTDTLKALPAPPAAVTQACADALKAGATSQPVSSP